MNEIQQLLAVFNSLERDMQRYSVLVKEVMASITMQEFVPEKVNTEMMQCIMELNTKQKECLKLYKQANLGDTVPKKMHIMREQIERRMKDERKLEYLEAVKKSFLSLYTEDAEVEEKLQGFKDKVVTIKVDKYPLEKCLVYIRPFAVFLTMIKSDDPVKAIEQVPVLNEYFGSALVAHITISKDIFIGEDAREFNLEGEEASDQSKDSAVKKETVQSAESSEKKADTAGEQTHNPEGTVEKNTGGVLPQVMPQSQAGIPAATETIQQAEASMVLETQQQTEIPATTEAVPQAEASTAPETTPQVVSASQDTPATNKKEAPVAKQKRVHPDSKRRSKPRQPKKVDLKALLEEEGFREDKLDDAELKQMQEQEKKGKKGRKDSNASVLKGTSNLGHF